MKLIFLDETSDSQNTNYLGVCGAMIDATRYNSIKREFLDQVNEFGWSVNKEFKGSSIFSISQGCPDVSVETRIALAETVLRNCSTDSISRIKFTYASTTAGSDYLAYLKLVEAVINSLLKGRLEKKLGKDLVSIICDERTDVSQRQLSERLTPIIEKKGCLLLEDIMQIKSSIATVGICYADIVGYLMSRKDNLSENIPFFEGLSEEQSKTNGQYRKFKTSCKLLENVRSISIIPRISEITYDGDQQAERSSLARIA